MKVSLQRIKQLALSNVLEIRWTRARPWLSDTLKRRILCTLSYELLNSEYGRITLNYRPPTQTPTYNPEMYNNVIVWDIMMQDWRTINCDDAYLLRQIPIQEFWPFFNESVAPLTTSEKIRFMKT